MSFCTVHQMPVGPRGCPQCLREEAVAHRIESGRFWRWAALVFGGIALLAALTLVLLPKPVRFQSVLDAEPFRAAIETTESALYTTERLTPEDRMALREGLTEFMMVLRKQLPTTAQRRAMDDYARFCTMTPVEAESDYFDVVAARQEWEKLRRQHFRPASWFRASSAALEQAQTSTSARGIPDDIPKYQAVIDELRLMNARAEAALQTPRDELDYDGRNSLEASRGDLKRDVERIRQQMPTRYQGMEPGWRRANDDLEAAVRSVAGALGPGRRSSGRYAIDQAQASLDAAPR